MSHARSQHPNAPLTPEGRRRMVCCVIDDDFGCPPLGAGVGHPGGEVGQIRAVGPPGVRRHRIGEVLDQVVAERRFATLEAGFRSVFPSLQMGGSHP